MPDHVWTVEQPPGTQVAKGYAPDERQAVKECMHYGIGYIGEGPVKIRVRLGRKVVFKCDITVATGTMELTP